MGSSAAAEAHPSPSLPAWLAALIVGVIVVALGMGIRIGIHSPPLVPSPVPADAGAD